MKKSIILAVAAIMIIAVLVAGCAPQQPQPQPPTAEQPQEQATPQQTPAAEPAAEEAQPQQPPQTQTPQRPIPADEDLYKDNLDEALDELSQLE